MKKVWEVCVVTFGARGEQAPLRQLLDEGWEPFAVTCLGNHEYALVWLRKLKTL